MISVLDAFCGCGGLSYGLSEAGVNPVWAFDIWNTATASYSQSHDKTKVISCSALEFLIMLADREYALPTKGDVDVLTGGPPCQGFCGFNRHRKIDDPRNTLVDAFFQLVVSLSPRIVLMENVTGLLSMDNGKIVEKLLASFEDIKYHARLGILQAGYYGVPQNRWRVFIFAAKSQDEIPLFPEPLHDFPTTAVHEARDYKKCIIKPISHLPTLMGTLLPKITVRDAIADLPPVDNGGRYEGPYLIDPMTPYQIHIRKTSLMVQAHQTICMQSLNLERVTNVPKRKGAGWLDLPDHLKPRNLVRGGTNSYDNRFGRLDWDGAFNTIVNKAEPYWSKVIHPVQDRLITARESARAQGLPDRMQFSGKLSDQYAQVGNAVPPPLARALGWEIRRALGDKNIDEEIEAYRQSMQA